MQQEKLYKKPSSSVPPTHQLVEWQGASLAAMQMFTNEVSPMTCLHQSDNIG
jgi:hypothetical protein